MKNIRRISTFQAKALRLQLLAIVTPDEKPSLKASKLPLFCSGRYTNVNESLFILLALPTLAHTVEPPTPEKNKTQQNPKHLISTLLYQCFYCGTNFVTALLHICSAILQRRSLFPVRHCLETRKNNIINTTIKYTEVISITYFLFPVLSPFMSDSNPCEFERRNLQKQVCENTGNLFEPILRR